MGKSTNALRAKHHSISAANSRKRRSSATRRRQFLIEALEQRRMLDGSDLLASASAAAADNIGDAVQFRAGGVTTRIVGGNDAPTGAWPWMASLQANGNHFCGGALIDDEWILTAAHCLVGKSNDDFAVVLGRHNLVQDVGQTHHVERIEIHPAYSVATPNDADIALVKLAVPSTRSTIKLAAIDQESLFDPGIDATVIGWGALSENGPGPTLLQQVTLPIVSNAAASAVYNPHSVTITDNMLAAGLGSGGRDSCQGDSGGPLMVADGDGGFLHAGIVSFGIGCARPGLFGIYTRTANFSDWIEQVTTAAQPKLTVTPLGTEGLTPEDLAQFLVGDSGITISNVHYQGADAASGIFSGGGPIIGIDEGILLTSGNVHTVIGPNDSPGAGQANGLPGHPLLDNLVRETIIASSPVGTPPPSTIPPTYDASILSFDFVPNGDYVEFSYVFGSEEYNEYVGSSFNDVFGLFINGVNYALIPQLDGDFAEPNDGISSALNIGALEGRHVYQGLSLHTPQDSDWIRFEMLEGGVPGHFIRAETAQARADLGLRIYDANHSLLAEHRGLGTAAELNLTTYAAGTYFVEVYSPRGEIVSDYRLLFSLPRQLDSDAAEPNPDQGSAFSLGPLVGRFREEGFSIEPADQDWFQFELESTSTQQDFIGIEFLHAAGDLDIELFDGSGNLLATSSSIGNIEQIQLGTTNPLQAGTYFLRVYGYSGATNPEYAIIGRGPFGESTPDFLEANDTRATAFDLGAVSGVQNLESLFGSDASNGLSIHSASDQDWIQFELLDDARAPHYIAASFQHGLGDIDISLHDGAGSLIQSSATVSDEERIALDGLSAGTYFLRVYGFNGAKNPSYDITFNAPADPLGNSATPIAINSVNRNRNSHFFLDNEALAERQRIVLTGDPSGGSFMLSLNGEQTATIALGRSPQATANNIQAALAGLNGLQETPTVSWLDDGANEVQRLRVTGSPTGGTFRLNYDGQLTDLIPFEADTYTTASNIQQALQMLAVDSVSVNGTDDSQDEHQRIKVDGKVTGGTMTLSYDGQVTNPIDMSQVSANIAANIDSELRALINTGLTSDFFVWGTTVGGVSEIQEIEVIGNPREGTFVIAIGEHTTAPISYSRDVQQTTAAIDSALRALTGTGLSGDFYVTPVHNGSSESQVIQVTGNPIGGTFKLKFGDEVTASIPFSTDYEETSASILSALTSLDGIVGDALISPLHNAIDELQQLTISGTPESGSFTLSLDAAVTQSISYSGDSFALAASIESALAALPGMADAVAVHVSGANSFLIQFKGGSSAQNIAQIEIAQNELAGPDTPTLLAETLTEGQSPTFLEFHVLFIGQDGANDQPELQLTDNQLTGGNSPTMTVVTTGPGSLPTYEKYQVYYHSLDGLKDIPDLTITSLDLSGGTNPLITARTITNGERPDASLFEVQFFGANGKKDLLPIEVEASSAIGDSPVTISSETLVEGAPVSEYQFEIAFGGTLGLTNVPQIVPDSVALEGGTSPAIIAETTQQGHPSSNALIRNEIQQLTIAGNPSQGSFKLDVDGIQTGSIEVTRDPSMMASRIAAAIGALSNINGDVVVTGSDDSSDEHQRIQVEGQVAGGTLTLQFGTSTTPPINFGQHPVLIGNEIEQRLRALPSTGLAGDFYVDSSYEGGTDELQSITVSGDPTGGTFQIEFNGNLSDPILYSRDYYVTANNIDQALRSLENSGLAGDFFVNVTHDGVNESQVITVTGSPTGGTFQLEFAGDQTSDIPFSRDLSATANAIQVALSQLGSLNDDVTVWANHDGIAEMQAIEFLGAPAGGTFVLSLSGESTAPIVYSSNALELANNIRSALVNLASLSDNIQVTSLSENLFSISFLGSDGYQDVPLLHVEANNLLGVGAVASVFTLSQGAPPSFVEFRVDFQGTMAAQDQPEILFVNEANQLIGGSSPTMDVQAIVNGQLPTSLVYSIGFFNRDGIKDQPQTAIVNGALEGDIQAELTAGTEFQGSFPTLLEFDVYFFGEDGSVDQPTLSIASNSLLGPETISAEVETIEEGAAPTIAEYVVEFFGTNDAINFPQMSASSVNFTGGIVPQIDISTLEDGFGTPGTVFEIFFSPVDGNLPDLTLSQNSLTGGMAPDVEVSKLADGNSISRNTQLDAQTTVMHLVAPVQRNETNTLWLAISDTDDMVFDSAVFIGARTLTEFVTGDFAEPNDNLSDAYDLGGLGAPLSIDNLSIHRDLNDDWFRFAIDRAGDVASNVSIAFSNAAGDLDLYLYTAEGLRIASSATTTNRESIQLMGVPAGTYYVQIAGYNGATNGEYSLTITPPAAAVLSPDAMEPNNSYETATDLKSVVGDVGPIGGQVNLHDADDRDWYAFQTIATGTADDWIRIDFDHRQRDVDLRLYRFDGNALVQLNISADVQNTELISLNGLPAGTYYAEVYGYSGATSPQYQFRLKAPAPSVASDWAEPNDDHQSPFDFRTVEGTREWPGLSIHPAGNDDWFRFETVGPGGAGHQVQIDFLHSLGDVDFKVFRDEGPIRLQVPAGGGSSIGDGHSFTIEDGSGRLTYEFDFNASVTPGRIAVPFTANSTQAEIALTLAAMFPNAVNLGDGIVELHGTASSSPVNYVARAFIEIVDLNGIPGILAGEAFDARIRIVHEQQLKIFSAYFDLAFDPATAAVNSIEHHTGFLNTGTVVSGLVDELGGINLSGELPPGAAIVTLHMTALTNGVPLLSLNAPDDLPSHDISFFNDNVPRTNETFYGSSIQHTLPESATVDMERAVVTANTSTLTFSGGLHLVGASSTTSDQESVNLAGQPSGNFLVQVFGYEGATNPQYQLTIVAPQVTIAADWAEPNDSRSQSFDLREIQGARSESALSLDTPGDDDWFRFVTLAQGGATDHVRVNFQHSHGDVDLQLVDAAGNVLSTSAGVGNEERISLQRLPAGEYFVRIYGFNDAVNRHYDLAIEAPYQTVPGDWAEPNDSRASAFDFRDVSQALTRRDLSIHPSGNDDWFRFVTLGTGRTGDHVRIDFAHAQGDIDLELLDANGEVLTASRSVSDQERISLDTRPAGVYYLRVVGLSGATNPHYTLSIQPPAAPSLDWAEPNDNRNGAYNLRLIEGVKAWSELSINTAGNDDWFRFETLATAGAGNHVRINFSHAHGDLDLRLIDSNGNLVNASNSITDQERINLAGLPAGVYYVQVVGYQGATNPRYDLTIDAPTAPILDWAEPNDSQAAAYDLRAVQGKLSFPHLSIDPAANEDWFRFEMLQPGRAGNQVSIEFLHANGDLDLRLRDGNGAIVKSSASVRDLESMSLDGLPAGVYFVQVSGFANSRNKDYTLFIDAPHGPVLDWAEPNDSRQESFDLRGLQGYSKWGGLSIDPAGNPDWFRFETAASGAAGNHVRISFLHASGDLDLQLYDANGNLIRGSATVADEERISLAGLPAGTYYVAVNGFAGATNPSYELVIEAPSAPIRDWAEPNDDQNGAYELRVVEGRLALAQLSIDPAENEDWFRFETAATGLAGNHVRINFLHANGDIDLRLRNANGDVVRSSLSVTNEERISLESLPAGVYYIQATGFDHARNPRYDLTIEAPDRPVADWAEPNNQLAAAYDLRVLEGNQMWTGLSLDPGGDHDWFRFELATVGVAGNHVGVNFLHANGDIDLRLHDQNGNVIASSERVTNEERISLTGLPAGVYYIQAFGYANARNSRYELVVDAPAEPVLDWAEPNDDSNQAFNLRQVEGTVTLDALSIDPAANQDWFRFELAGTGVAGNHVRIKFLHANGDVDLRLRDVNGNLIASSLTVADEERVTLQNLPAGTYYIQVSGYENSKNPAYSLTIDAPVPPVLDWAEPNDDRVGAYNLRTLEGSSTFTGLSIDPAANEDWFRFELPAVGAAGNHARINFLHALGDLDLQLRDSNGVLIAESKSIADEEWISLAGLSAGVYYVQVVGFENTKNPNYSLTIDAPFAPVLDWAEPNDDRGTAYDLRVVSGAVTLAGLSIDPAANEDWFRFETTATGSTGDHVRINLLHANGDIDLVLRDAAGVMIGASRTVNDEERIGLGGLPIGIYYIQALSPTGSKNPHYELTIQAPVIAALDWAEPNDTRLTAYDLRAIEGAAFWPNLSIDPAANEDWFRFEMLSEGLLQNRAEVRFEGTSGQFRVELYDVNGNILSADGGATGSVALQLAGLPAGVYVLRVLGLGNVVHPQYSLSIDAPFPIAANAIPDPLEPNETMNTAYQLRTIGDSLAIDGLSIHSNSERDWFAFTTLEAASSFHYIRLEFLHAQGDLDVELYNGNGELLRWSDSAENSEHISLDGLSAGTYYFQVYGYSGAVNSDYSLRIEAPTAGVLLPDRFEANESAAQATGLRNGETGLLAGSHTYSELTIHSISDVDYYRFETVGTASAAHSISVFYTPGDGALQVALFDENLAPVGTIVSHSGLSTVAIEGLPAGNYFLRVQGDAASNRYGIQMDLPIATEPSAGADEWTIMVYMTASNLDEYAFADINELELAASRLPGSVNLVVLWDQSARESTYATGAGTQPAWGTAGRGVIRPDSDRTSIATTFELLGELNTGDGQTLINFVDWATETAPAERYALMMWDHGAGIYGFNVDDSDSAHRDYLTTDELVAALETVDSRMDLIAFDACLMAFAEVGYSLRSLTDVFVASQEVVGGDGHDYTTLFQVLFEKPQLVTAETLGTGFVQSYERQYGGGKTIRDTYSAVRTSGYTALTSAMRDFVDATEGASGEVLTALTAARDAAIGYEFEQFRDLGRFMQLVTANETLGTDLCDAAAEVIAALAEMTIARTSDTRRSSGTSAFMAVGNTVAIDKYAQDYPEFANETRWNTLLQRLSVGAGSGGGAGGGRSFIKPDWAEVNEVPAHAFNLRTLHGDTNVLPKLSFHSAQDVDWFRFSLDAAAGSGDEVKVVPANPASELLLQLFDSSGQVVLRESTIGTGSRTIELDGLPAGLYFVRVDSETAVSSYDLIVDAPEGNAASDWAGDNSSPQKSYDLGLVSGQFAVSGLGVASDSEDWFAFSTPRLPGATSFVITVVASDGQFLSAELLDADENFISSGSGTGNFQLPYTASGSGETLSLVIYGGTTMNRSFESTGFTLLFERANTPPTVDSIVDLLAEEDDANLNVSVTGISAGTGDLQPIQVTAVSDNVLLIPSIVVDYVPGSPTATLFFTPTPDLYGTAVISITVTDAGDNGVFGDADDASTLQSVTISITEQNDAPNLSHPGDHSLAEEETLSFTLSATDPDVATGIDDEVTYSIVNGSVAGMVLNSTSGAFTWTPSEAQEGNYIVVFRAVDDRGGVSEDQTVTITVTDVNEPPSFVNPGSKAVNEKSSLAFTLTAIDDDVFGGDADTVSYSFVSGNVSGMTLETSTGAFNWTPTEAQDGTFVVVFGARDNRNADANHQTVTITVQDVNDPPSLPHPGNVSGNEKTSFGFVLTGSDLDSLAGVADSISYSVISGLASGMTLDENSGVFSWTPTELQDGEYVIVVNARDNHGATSANRSITITVNDINDPPVLAAPGNKAADEKTALSFSLSASDNDSFAGVADSVSYSIVSGAMQGMNLDTSSGAFSWTPSESQDGEFEVVFGAKDNRNAVALHQTITITVHDVNDPPLLADPADIAVDEKATIAFSLSATDTDIFAGVADSVSYSIVSGLVNGMTLDANTGAFSWTPTELQDGEYEVVFAAKDSRNAVGLHQTIMIIVQDVNDPPLLADPGDKDVDEKSAIGFTLSAIDNDSFAGVADSVTYAIVSGLVAGMSLNASSGAFLWTPTELQDGEYEVVFSAKDNRNSVGLHQTITITVHDVNDPPLLAHPGNQAADENTAISFSLSATDNDSFAGVADSVSYSIVSGAATGMALDATSGAFSWQPTELQDGDFEVVFGAKDPRNGIATHQTVTIVVREVNDPPAFTNPGDKSVSETDSLEFSLSATDSDVTAGISDALTYSIESGGADGMTLDANSGAFAWAPSDSQDGEHVVVFAVRDSHDVVSKHTITITVQDFNEPPVLADPGNQTVDELAAIEFALEATDLDSLAGVSDVITYSIVSGAIVGMTFDTTTGSFAWTPSEDQDGVHVIVFGARDNHNAAAAHRTVTITVNELNDPPQLANPGHQTADEKSTIEFTLLATDSDIVAGAANSLRYFFVSGNAVGMTLDEVSGEFNWTPAESHDGEHVVVFVARDDSNSSSTHRTVTISVDELNDPPVFIQPTNVTTAAQQEVSIQLAASDNDIIAGLPDAVTFAVESGLKSGMELDASGLFRWTPGSDQIGEHIVQFRATDRQGLAVDHLVTISVSGSNDAPTDISLSNVTVDENAQGAEIGALLVTDPNASDSHTFDVSDSRFEVAEGKLRLKEEVQLDFEAAEPLVIEITATDSGSPALSVTKTFTLTVQDVNDPPTAVALSSNSIKENVSGALVGKLSASDQDPGQTVSFTTNDVRFEIVNGDLRFKPDQFADLDDGSTIVVEVIATDDGDPSSSTTQALSIEVTPNQRAWQNTLQPVDTNGDGSVVPLDALRIINQLNDPTVISANGKLPDSRSAGSTLAYFDTNGDGFCTTNDVLRVINFLNNMLGEGEHEPVPETTSALFVIPVWPAPTVDAASTSVEQTSNQPLLELPKPTLPVAAFVKSSDASRAVWKLQAGDEYRSADLEDVLADLAADLASCWNELE